jgi:hypothetical protein
MVGGANLRAKWSLVSIETENATYVGRVYVPETKRRLSDVLCDERPFVNLTDVSINGRTPSEPFVAVNKSCIRTVRVLQDEVGSSEVEES